MTYRDFLAAKRAGFKPPTGADRCPRCALHMPTQGHRVGCPREKKK